MEKETFEAQEKIIKLPSGSKVKLKRFSLKDLFLFLRILEKVTKDEEFKLETEIDTLRFLGMLSKAEDEIKELLKSITDIQDVDNLPAIDVVFIVKEVFKQEDFASFFEIATNSQQEGT